MSDIQEIPIAHIFSGSNSRGPIQPRYGDNFVKNFVEVGLTSVTIIQPKAGANTHPCNSCKQLKAIL